MRWGRLHQTSVHSSQSLDNEQPGLCVFYIEVASHVTVDWRSEAKLTLRGEPESHCSTFSYQYIGKDSFHQTGRELHIQTFMHQSVVLGQLLQLSCVARLLWGGLANIDFRFGIPSRFCFCSRSRSHSRSRISVFSSCPLQTDCE